MALIADYQASKIAEPSKRAFNFPAFPVSSKFSTILLFVFRSVAPMRHNHIYFQMLKTLSKWITVIPFIGNKSFRALFRSAPPSSWHVNRIEGLFGKSYFRWRHL